MRVLVTGALGKVGAAVVDALHAAGHEVTGCDLRPPVYEVDLDRAVRYVQADLTDAGDAFAVVRGHDSVIHAAALPDPQRTPAHVVFRNNLGAAFNVIEAAVRWGVPRFVNVSSETVPGWFFNERPDRPDRFPIMEDQAPRPQDPYALAKHFTEQLCDAAVRRSDMACLSLRPSWVQWEGNYERNLGPGLRSTDVAPSPSGWAYIDVDDLADALLSAAESSLRGHHVCNIASADNALGRPLADLVAAAFGDDVPLASEELERPDASGTSIAAARRLLAYEPRRSWRDRLDGDGHLLPEVAERLRAGDTAVQRGRAALS